MILEFDSSKVGISSPHFLSGDGWRVQLVDGLNEIPEDLAAKIQDYDGIEVYTKSGAIAFRKTSETPFERRTELEQLYETNGYQPIADIATGYGIAKPKAGWRDAIPLIIEFEKLQDESTNLG
jgi:hypothetical protein